MNFLAVLFLACIAIHSGFSSDPALNTSSLSGSIPASEELETCPTNSSITVKVLRSLQGDWVTTFVATSKVRNISRSINVNVKKDVMECKGSKYITISGYLMDKDADNSSEVFVGEHGNISGGEYSGKGIPTKSDMIFLNQTLGEYLNVSIKSSDRMEKMENRLDSVENTLQSFNETMHQIKNMLKNVPSYRMEKIESRLDSIENTLQSFNETMMNVLKNMPGNGYDMHFDDLVKGKKIMLLNNLRTAIRKTPYEVNGWYGGVLSKYHLRDDVAFEVRIDESIDEYRNWGIGLGVIVEKDEAVKEKALICHNVPGTYCIESWPFSDKGKSDIRKDCKVIRPNAYNLDTRYLPVGTTLGVLRRSNNALHFLLNGIDQGAAFDNIPLHVYAFVDVSNYVTKISILS